MELINNKYKIEEILGEGKFGKVYKGCILKSGEKVAIKMENINVPVRILKHETTIINHLYNNGCRCIPYIYWYGIHNNFTCLIMSYYRFSLDKYIRTIEITNKKINNIMVKTIELIESIHKHFIIHRDIKPQNFMLGENKELYLIDFGLANTYTDESNKHISNNLREYIIGTPRFMSYNIHEGNEPSRRDDLISIGYMYLYFYFNNLSWDIHSPIHDDNYCELHILNKKNIFRKDKKH